ncbi:diguanylate cyclase [Massilia sp. METH4]|uniref:GGDEF domain-containing protein n=1 Tax=Massilia sp. METH4 TaxID=3123041 RepID=UPI0030CF40D6
MGYNGFLPHCRARQPCYPAGWTAEKTPKSSFSLYFAAVSHSISLPAKSHAVPAAALGYAPKPSSAAARATVSILCAVTFFFTVIETWSRYTAWKSQLGQSAVAVENIALAADEHAEGTLNTVSWLIDGLVERVETDGIAEAAERIRLRDYMRTRLGKKNSALHGMFVYGARGELLISSDKRPAWHVTIGDRPYFAHHREHATREVHVGPPIVSRTDGEWEVTLSRRFDDRNGNFAGIVLATIPVSYFERYFRRFAVGKQGAMLLAMKDGTVVIGSRSGKDRVGTSVANSPLFEHMRQTGSARDTVMLATDFDGAERMISYRRLADYPVVVVAALAKDEILADWWTVTRQEAAAIVFMLATLYALGGWLLAHIRHKQQLEMRLRLAQADLEAKNAALDRMAHSDALTGLANRRSLDERLASEVGRAAREGGSVALVMIDVDFFKRYNDSLGHAAGDDCLRRVAAAIATAVHRPADLAARFGGEEFAIVLPDTDRAGARQVAEAARAAVGALALPHPANGKGIVTISAGVASFRPGPAESARLLVEAADAALYRAKEEGRDRVAD